MVVEPSFELGQSPERGVLHRRMRRFIAACFPDGEGIVDLWGPKRVVVEWAGDWDGEDDYEIGVYDLELPDRADHIDIAVLHDELWRRNRFWAVRAVASGVREFDRLFDLYIRSTVPMAVERLGVELARLEAQIEVFRPLPQPSPFGSASTVEGGQTEQDKPSPSAPQDRDLCPLIHPADRLIGAPNDAGGTIAEAITAVHEMRKSHAPEYLPADGAAALLGMPPESLEYLRRTRTTRHMRAYEFARRHAEEWGMPIDPVWEEVRRLLVGRVAQEAVDKLGRPPTNTPRPPTAIEHPLLATSDPDPCESDPDESAWPDGLFGVLESLRRGQAELSALVKESIRSVPAQLPGKEWYTVAEAADVLGKVEYTVREWLRNGRMAGQKRECGRGKSREWMISSAEMTRYRNEGLLPRR